MDKMEAIKRINNVDFEHNEVYIAVVPKVLKCDICQEPTDYVRPDVELGICACGSCSQLIARLRKLPDEVASSFLMA